MTRAVGAAAIGVILCALTTSPAGQAGSGSCDRGCLQGVADAYLAALVVHDPKIHEIEAMGFTLPLYSKNGWSQFTRQLIG